MKHTLNALLITTTLTLNIGMLHAASVVPLPDEDQYTNSSVTLQHKHTKQTNIGLYKSTPTLSDKLETADYLSSEGFKNDAIAIYQAVAAYTKATTQHKLAAAIGLKREGREDIAFAIFMETALDTIGELIKVGRKDEAATICKDLANNPRATTFNKLTIAVTLFKALGLKDDAAAIYMAIANDPKATPEDKTSAQRRLKSMKIDAKS